MWVLLIEDEELLLNLLIDLMTDAGFKVIGASDATSALELVRAVLLPQIIISDVNLGPGMDGFALAALARRRWPAVPVLMMSGRAANFAGRHRRTNERFLVKPFSLDTFLRNVTDLVGAG